MRRLNFIPWALGLCLVVGSLLGARAIQSNTDAGSPPPPPAKKPAHDPLSLVQSGTVDTEDRPVAYGLPAHLPAATVAEVLVREGDEVKAGQVLVRFDAELLKADLAGAMSQHAARLAEWQAADNEVKTYNLMDRVKQALDDAEAKLKAAREVRDATARQIDTGNRPSLQGGTIDQSKFDQLRRENGQMVAAEKQVEDAQRNVDARKTDKADAENGLVRLKDKATAQAAAANAVLETVKKAKLAVERCELKAAAAGVAERVDAAVGQTVGPQTRAPLVYVVPKGERVVRVEVVPDFAHKLHGQEGKKVTIADEQVPGNIYEGVVHRIGSAFLPRKSAGPDLQIGKPTTVLEVVVKVTDSAPAGKPPLRVGQPVRVHFQ